MDTNHSIAAQLHVQWLGDSVTKRTLAIIEKREQNLISFISGKSTDKETTAESLRWYAAQLQEIKQLKKEIYDTKTFVEKLG